MDRNNEYTKNTTSTQTSHIKIESLEKVETSTFSEGNKNALMSKTKSSKKVDSYLFMPLANS